MRSHVSNGKKNTLKLIFNLVWWILWLIAGFLYLYSPIAKRYWFITPGYLWFIYTFGPVLAIQTTMHWFILNFFFPDKRRSNIAWVLSMPFMLLFGFGFLTILLYFVGLSQLSGT